jgi:hypothetical protein
MKSNVRNLAIAGFLAAAPLWNTPANAGNAWNCNFRVECRLRDGCVGSNNFAVTEHGLMQFGGGYGGPFYIITRNDSEMISATLKGSPGSQTVSIDKKTGHFEEVFSKDSTPVRKWVGVCHPYIASSK